MGGPGAAAMSSCATTVPEKRRLKCHGFVEGRRFRLSADAFDLPFSDGALTITADFESKLICNQQNPKVASEVRQDLSALVPKELPVGLIDSRRSFRSNPPSLRQRNGQGDRRHVTGIAIRTL
jgi:hypothetical protein